MGLRVCFNNGARKEDEETLHLLATEIRDAFSNAICVTMHREFLKHPDRASWDRTQYNTHIHPDNFQEAFDFMNAKAKGDEIIVVSLCEEMLRAASSRDIKTVTIGAPLIDIDHCVYAADVCYVPGIIRQFK